MNNNIYNYLVSGCKESFYYNNFDNFIYTYQPKFAQIDKYILSLAFCLIFLGYINLLLNTSSLIFTIMSLEILLLGLGLFYIFIDLLIMKFSGFLMVICLIIVAVIEAVLGFTFLVLQFKYSEKKLQNTVLSNNIHG